MDRARFLRRISGPLGDRCAVRRSLEQRVPQLTVLFWAVKLLTTGAGETTSDYFVKAFDPVAVVLVAAVVFVACFAIQFSARRYVPWRYWLFVAMVAVFGTMVAGASWASLVLLLLVLPAIASGFAWFFRTHLGLALRAAGDNPRMARA